ncbi:MAG: type secretion protein [Bradyrhizobium sp.]|nr:type secretion protein [Bradyrhizobium sp.]
MISDPGSSSPIVAGVTWIEHALLGTAATAIAVICVAAVGYQFLTGHIPARRAVTVIVGCFILFGAPSIAGALSALAGHEPAGDAVEQAAPSAPEAAPMPLAPSPAPPNPFDPYSGQ